MPHQPDFIAIEHRLGAHTYKPLGVVLAEGKGVRVTDTDGRRSAGRVIPIHPPSS